MTQLHSVYLILGSNIRPEINLQSAVDLLPRYGKIAAASSVWESHAVGSRGPNFLNAAVLFLTETDKLELKDQIMRPIEASLKRVRGEDQNAPRTIDIDIMMVDGEPVNLDRWNSAFVILPLAELMPTLIHPLSHERLPDAAAKVRAQTWMLQHPEIQLLLTNA